MGHSSIQVTVDIYGYLIAGAIIAFVDALDSKLEETQTLGMDEQQSATGTQQGYGNER